jgi:hypothetical protein
LRSFRQPVVYDCRMTKHGHKIGRERICGPGEVAAIAGVRHRTVVVWRNRGIMPDPDAVISGVPLWREKRIVEWLRTTGRLSDGA